MSEAGDRPALPQLLTRRELSFAGIVWLLLVTAILTGTWIAMVATQGVPALAPAIPERAAPPQTVATAGNPPLQRAEANMTPFVALPTAQQLVSREVHSSERAASPGILDVTAHPQARNLNCEFQAASDLAAYHGYALDWKDIYVVVGSDAGGDPNRGFAGRSMDDPPGGIYPSGYGVYAEPIALGLRSLGVAATAHSDVTTDWLRAQLDAGNPVVIWATYDMRLQPVVNWQSAEGVDVRGVRYEHTYIIIGYDDVRVWALDPLDAARKQFDWTLFDNAWSLLGHMALTIEAGLIE